MDARRVLIGVVGCYPFLRDYPLGPDFMQGLQNLPWPEGGVAIREMNWGPIAIIQDMQEMQAQMISYDRVVLVSAAARGRAAGSIGCRRWLGGAFDPLAVQQRVYEGVTGVISLDNLLVIGDYFKVWPDEVVTVEIELPQGHVGDLVLAELVRGPTDIVGAGPLSAQTGARIRGLLELSRRAATGGIEGLPALTADELNPTGVWCQNRFIEEGFSA